MTRLIFIGGGPWHDKELDTRVENAPERIDPASDCSGTYKRLGVADGDAVVYMWQPGDQLGMEDRLEDCVR
jgi:hypothetical protein